MEVRKRFEELSKVKDVEVNGKVEMIHTFSRLGKKTIELHEISKSFEQKKLFDEFSYMFKQHDRIGILGDNGTGLKKPENVRDILDGKDVQMSLPAESYGLFLEEVRY